MRNDPLNLVDTTGQAPNKEGATDYRYVEDQIEEGGLSRLRENTGNVGRYFHTENYGWVDVRHFGEAAALVLSEDWHPAAVIAAGVAVEIEQAATEEQGDYRSAFSPEDLSSNSAGVDFAEFARNDARSPSLGASFGRWARGEGASQFGDQTFEDAFAALPESDPSRPATKQIKMTQH